MLEFIDLVERYPEMAADFEERSSTISVFVYVAQLRGAMADLEAPVRAPESVDEVSADARAETQAASSSGSVSETEGGR